MPFGKYTLGSIHAVLGPKEKLLSKIFSLPAEQEMKEILAEIVNEALK